MQNHNFQYCCGAMEIGGLGWANTTATMANLKQLVANARQANKGLVICTTIRQQTAAVKMLRQAKFRVLTTFINPNTGNVVTLWGKETH